MPFAVLLRIRPVTFVYGKLSRSVASVGDRKGQTEAGAMWLHIRQLDLPVMQSHDLGNEVKAESGALAAPPQPIERLENLIAFVF